MMENANGVVNRFIKNTINPNIAVKNVLGIKLVKTRQNTKLKEDYKLKEK